MKKLLFICLLFSLAISKDLNKLLQYQKATLQVLGKNKAGFKSKIEIKVEEKIKSPIIKLLEINPEIKKEKTIILYDNGTNGDEIAGDGIYSTITYISSNKKVQYFIKKEKDNLSQQVLFEYVLFSW